MIDWFSVSQASIWILVDIRLSLSAMKYVPLRLIRGTETSCRLNIYIPRRCMWNTAAWEKNNSRSSQELKIAREPNHWFRTLLKLDYQGERIMILVSALSFLNLSDVSQENKQPSF